ncbi:unnamed protein product [Rhodiola kirilowii]
MPPQDSQTLVGTSCDSKIRCAKDDDDHAEEEREDSEHPVPESFWLSKDAELDWFDRNAFFDRKDSTKANQNHNSVSNSNPSSQRFSKSKTSIIGLPKPQQKPCLVDARHRRNQTNSRLFPKRGAEPMAEPSSPKVSCMGRVKSRRDRNRRLKNRQRSLKSSSSDKPTIERLKKKGLWKNFRSIFRSGPGHKPVTEPGSQTQQETTKTGHVLSRDLSSTATVSVGLGGMTRFSSGLRSDGWVGEVAEIRSGGNSLQ